MVSAAVRPAAAPKVRRLTNESEVPVAAARGGGMQGAPHYTTGYSVEDPCAMYKRYSVASLTVRVAGATVVSGVIGHCQPSQINKLDWLYN